jgi:Mycobacterium membrane protein
MSTMNHLDSEIYDYPDDDIYPDSDALYGPVDQRWRPVAAIAGIVFVLAVIASVVIVNGGDSASTSATVAPPTRTVIATPRPTAPTAPPGSSLSPETITTVTPPPRQPTAGPSEVPTATPPPEASPVPTAEVTPRTFVYRVTGTKGILDLVSIVYTDAQGMPHTDFNVSLPWSKVVVLDPGVQLKSVTATSLTSRLNCAITDAAGQPVVVAASNSIIATCTR